MKDAARLKHLLSRASQRAQSSSERVDRAAHRLEKAVASHDQVEIKAGQLEYDVATAVFNGWLGHQGRLLRQLGHLVMVRWTKVLGAATVVLALATLALIWATLTT